MGSTTGLRQEIKKQFEPFMVHRGYLIDRSQAPVFTIFRKITSDTVYLSDVQWEKYGRPRFTVNFGKCGLQGIVAHDGKHIPSGDMLPSWAPVCGRLQPGRSSSSAGWFRQDRPWLERFFSGRSLYDASAVVTQLIRFFPEVEHYWADGTVGPHMKVFPNSSAKKGLL